MEHSRFNLSRWALEHQPLTRFLLVALLLGGIFAYSKLGQDEDPPFTFRAMVVQAFWPGATAEQMSRQVTDKIEKALQEVPYAWKIRSYSKPGETLVTFQLADTSPAKETKQLWYTVRKKVGDIAPTLPQGVRGPYFNDDFGDVYGSIYALSADGFTYRQLNDYADSIRQQLLRVPNVAKVETLGDQDEKIYIEFQQAKLAQMGLDINSIATQIGQQNNIGPSGVLVTPTDNVQIRLSGQFSDIRDLENLTLRGPGGTTNIRLGDIATVKHGYIDPPHAKMRYNGKEVIGLGISMTKGGDIIQLGKDLRATVDKIRAKLPMGIEMEQVQNQPKSVQNSVGEFVHVLIEAVVIVLGVSFLSLGLHTKPKLRIDVWPGLVVGLTIPLVLAVTFLFMNIFDIGLHKISLGALIIALGLLVDDAIIAVEMMVRKLEEGFSKMEAATFAYSSTAMPMLTGTLITATGFLPVGLARSTVGEYTFGIFAVTALALVLSWFAAVVFVPYLGFLLLRTKSHVGDGGHHELFDTPFYNRFRGWVNWCVEYRKTVIVVTLVTFGLGVFGFKFIEKQFFPDSSRPELMVELWLPEGSSFSQTEAEAKRFETLMRKEQNVDSVTLFIGSGAPRFYLPLDQILPQTNVAQAIIMPTSLEARAGVRQHVIGLLKSQFPHLRGRVKLLPNGPPVQYPVQFRVMGPDMGGVRKIADQVKAIMVANPNTVGVNDNWNENVKTLRLNVDQDKARALGVTSQALAQASRTLLSGTVIGQYREADKLIDIVLVAKGLDPDKVSTADLRKMFDSDLSDPKSFVNILFTAPVKYDGKDAYALRCLGEVMDIKLVEKLREEKGGVYGVGASGTMAKIPYSYYSFNISFPCAPENADTLSQAAIDELKKIINGGVPKEDIEKVKEQRRIAGLKSGESRKIKAIEHKLNKCSTKDEQVDKNKKEEIIYKINITRMKQHYFSFKYTQKVATNILDIFLYFQLFLINSRSVIIDTS